MRDERRPRPQGQGPQRRPNTQRGQSQQRRSSSQRGQSSQRQPNTQRGQNQQRRQRPTKVRPSFVRGSALSRGNIAQVGLGAGAIVLSAILVFFAVRGIFSLVVRSIFAPPEALSALASGEGAGEGAEGAQASQEVDVNLVMIGDILQHQGVFQSGFNDDGTRNYDHVFAHIGPELEGADIKVVNQETLLGGESFGFGGYPSFNGPQEMGDAEVKAGFNVVLRATNHAMDYGYEGLASEISYWHTTHPEVALIGAVDPNDATASIEDVYVYEKDGFKIALLNYTYDLNGFEDPRGVVSTLDEEHVRRTVTAAKEQADMVVVFPHWGEEYNLEPVESQYHMADIFMECGADVIIGGHPHVIEPVEILTAPDGRKVPCFWSVGNFISTQIDNENLIGGVAKVTMHKDADGNCSVTACSFVPTVTHKGLGTDMTTYLLRDYTDDMATTNYLASNDTDNTDLTVAWANDFCTQVLGSGFDVASEQIVFGAEALAPDSATVTPGTAAEEPGAAVESGTAAEVDELPAAA